MLRLLTVCQRRVPEHLSPPLLPREQFMESVACDLSMLDMEQASDDSVPEWNKAAEFERETGLDFNSVEGQRLIDEVENNLKFRQHGLYITLPKRRVECAKLKLDSPVQSLESVFELPNPVKQVSFAELLEEDIETCDLPKHDDSLWESLLDDENLAEMAALALEKTDNANEKERLIKSNITARVVVPDMAAFEVNPPWLESSSAADSFRNVQFMLEQQRLPQLGCQISSALERQLPWAPFSSSLSRLGQESFTEHNEYLDQAMTRGNCFESHELLWKPEILRLMGFSDVDEEELSEAYASNFGTDKEAQRAEQTMTTPMECSTIIPRKRSPACDQADASRPLKSPRVNSSQGRFSSLGALSSFLEIRGKEFAKTNDPLEESKFQGSSQVLAKEPKRDSEIAIPKGILVPATQRPVAPLAELASPRSTSVARTLIVNTTLLQTHQSLLSRLEKQSHILIYRDYADGSAPDIIISPRACILLTTLQAAHQCSLPGQKLSHAANGPVQARVIMVSKQFEDVFVLAVQFGADSLIKDGCAATLSFNEFIARHVSHCRIRIILVPSMTPVLIPGKHDAQNCGQLHHLLNWILALGERYGHGNSNCDTAIELIQDETKWELFLRKAGLNPYAAQVIINKTKSISGQGFSGLRALVALEGEERWRLLHNEIGSLAVNTLNVALQTGWR